LRISLLLLALVAATGTTMLGVMLWAGAPKQAEGVCRLHADSIGPAWTQTADQENKRHQIVTTGETIPFASGSIASQSGFEMPFAPGRGVPASTMSAENDPAALCAALRVAFSDGRGAELAAIRTRLLALGTDAVPSISGLLHSGADRAEVEAVRLLVQIGNSEGLALALGKLLAVPRESPTYGLFLAAFADNHSPAVAQWLTDTLGKAQYAETRERMLDLLNAMRGQTAVAALEQTALNPMDDLHAQDSIDCLALRHDPSETAGLANLLESEDESIREAAAYGLAYIGSSEACQILADYADAFPVYADALASISSTYAQEELLALATSSTRSVVVRASAVQSLASRPSQRVQTVLANAVIQEPNTIVADAMQAALNTMASDWAEHSEIIPNDKGYEGELWF
jgi:hypothetical protein